MKDSKFRYDGIVPTSKEARAEAESWSGQHVTMAVGKVVSAAEERALKHLCRVASTSADPNVREAWAYYDATVATQNLLEKPLKKE